MKRVNKVEERIVFEKTDYLNEVVTEVFEKQDALGLKLATEHGVFYAYSYNNGIHQLIEEGADANWASSKNMTVAASAIIDEYIKNYNKVSA